MIKALLVITGIAGMNPYTVDMDTMAQCQLQANEVIAHQPTPNIKAFCLPRQEKTPAPDKVENVIKLFMDSIERLQDLEIEKEEYCFRHSFDHDCNPQSPTGSL